MIAYLDASALVKRYVAERGSDRIAELTASAESVATSVVSRAEVSAAFAKAGRTGLLTEQDARTAQRAFVADWKHFARIPITESLVARAGSLAWDQALRGYDAVQLASALAWQESIGTEVVFSTFDQHLWTASREVGLIPWPEDLGTRS